MKHLTILSIPSATDTTSIEINTGNSIVFIGANGAGKTRLGVYIETKLAEANVNAHRIAAHRSLLLNPNVIPPNFETAQNRLLYGHENAQHGNKYHYRWSNNPAVVLLNDFDALLGALYADNNQISLEYRQSQLEIRDDKKPPESKLDKLKEIWQGILPHRELIIYAGNIKVKPSPDSADEYAASELSDGERVIFYLIGQALMALPNTVLIFDEPELHINKAVLDNLWDAIESARKDCNLIYITHDISFSSARRAAAKYAVRSYQKKPNDRWEIQPISDDASIPSDIVAKIIGSRRAILFIEGDNGSLDLSLYRKIYNEYTVIPVGSCEQTIHTVTSFISRQDLHYVGCAGIVDTDWRTPEEKTELEQHGVYCLPVSEVENIFLLPRVFLAVAKEYKFDDSEAREKLGSLQNFVFEQAEIQIDHICLRYVKRRIDSKMKKIGLKSIDIASLCTEYGEATSTITPRDIFENIKSKINEAILQREYEKVLLYYDNKGLLSEVARSFGHKQRDFEAFIGRLLQMDSPSELLDAIKSYLPVVRPKPQS